MERVVLEVILIISLVMIKWGSRAMPMLVVLLVAFTRKGISRVEFGVFHLILITSTLMLSTKMTWLRAIQEQEDSSRSVPMEVRQS